jgi:predicted component of type VI protein secretion system
MIACLAEEDHEVSETAVLAAAEASEALVEHAKARRAIIVQGAYRKLARIVGNIRPNGT